MISINEEGVVVPIPKKLEALFQNKLDVEPIELEPWPNGIYPWDNVLRPVPP